MIRSVTSQQNRACMNFLINENYSRTFIFFSALFLAVFGGSRADAQSGAPRDDKETLRYLKEVEWPKSYREQDQKLLDRILADEYQRIDADGAVSTKAEEMAYIKTNKPSYESFRFEIKRLEIFENGTAIVAGTGHIRGKDKDGAYYVVYQSSNILIKRGELWKAIASHVSGVKRMPGEKRENSN